MSGSPYWKEELAAWIATRRPERSTHITVHDASAQHRLTTEKVCRKDAATRTKSCSAVRIRFGCGAAMGIFADNEEGASGAMPTASTSLNCGEGWLRPAFSAALAAGDNHD
jgi:hypothetical protein